MEPHDFDKRIETWLRFKQCIISVLLSSVAACLSTIAIVVTSDPRWLQLWLYFTITFVSLMFGSILIALGTGIQIIAAHQLLKMRAKRGIPMENRESGGRL